MAGDVLGEGAKGLVGYEEGTMEGMPAGETQLSRGEECSIDLCQWRPFSGNISGCRAAGEQPQGERERTSTGIWVKTGSRHSFCLGREVGLFGGAVRAYSGSAV